MSDKLIKENKYGYEIIKQESIHDETWHRVWGIYDYKIDYRNNQLILLHYEGYNSIDDGRTAHTEEIYVPTEKQIQQIIKWAKNEYKNTYYEPSIIRGCELFRDDVFKVIQENEAIPL